MRDYPLPADLVHFSHLLDLAYRGNNEWSSACPHCGGFDGARRDKSDRFRLFAADNHSNARVWCRGCGFFEWADSDDEPPSQEAIEKAQRERVRLAKRERERVKSKIVQLQEAAYWQGWHDAMTEQQRQLWHHQGIADYFIDYYRLGYTPNHTYFHEAREYHSPAMTIPCFGYGWEAQNVQYRLIDPVPGAGKYRMTAGLPASLFLTEPDEQLTDAVLMVEGAKKAIVVYARLGMEPLGFRLNVVAVPSKTPSKLMLDQLDNADPIYIMLDPDALYSDRGIPAVNRVVSKLGRSRCRVVPMMVKPDDLFTIYGGDPEDMIALLRTAKP